jgi:hypothetical protein
MSISGEQESLFLHQFFLDLFFCMTIDTMMKTTATAEMAMITSSDIFGPTYYLTALTGQLIRHLQKITYQWAT